MGKKSKAILFTLKESIRPFKKTGDAKDGFEALDMGWKLLVLYSGIGAPSALAIVFSSKIPGIKDLWPGVFPAIVIGILYLVMIFVTAIRFRMQIMDIQDAAKSHLRVQQGKEESTGTIVRGWGLEVWNDGLQSALGLHASLERMEFAHPVEAYTLDQWPTLCDLHWARQIDDDSINISGRQAKRLNVFYYNNTNEKVELSYHRATELYREQNALPFDYPVLVLISIGSEQEKEPIYVVCRLDPKAARSRLYQTEPLRLLYAGDERPCLSDYKEPLTR